VTADIVRFRRLDADGAGLSARLTGEASIATGLLSLTGQMILPEKTEARALPQRRVDLPIRIGGTLSEPVAAVVAAGSLSGAADPH
jgi:hypothetical protein